MIFVRDKGRLCNNILQYSHLYAWGREHGRRTMSMRFAYKYQYFHICHTRYHHFATYLVAKYGAKAGLIPVVSFNSEKADYSQEEALLKRQRWVVAEGWYAHWYDLFLKYKPEILSLFRFLPAIEQHVAATMTAAESNITAPAIVAHASQRGSTSDTTTPLRLGLHIRRGDYARWYDGKYYYSDRQYAAIAKQFLALHADRQVIVYICGNDPQLDRELFRQELGAQVVFPNGSPGEDLCLLSHCHYLIGPPSTFTLVAAMYHDTPLYWVKDPSLPLTPDSFDTFDHLFRHIL
jgi:hypothetical protein